MKDIEVLLLSRRDMMELGLEPDEVLESVEQALREHAAGTYEMHPKIGVHPTGTDPGNFLHAMPAYLQELDVCGLKWVGGFPRNRERDLPNVTGVQVYNDTETGIPLAIMDCGYLTGLRTAAVSASIARRCARPGAETLALVGCGFEGAKHLQFLTHALPGLRRLRLHDIRHEAMTSLRDQARQSFSGEIEICKKSEECIRGADVISTCTNGDVQIIEKEWFAPGTFGVGIEGGCAYTAPALQQVDKFMVDDIPLAEHFQKISLEHPDALGEICEEFPGGIPPVYATIGEIVSGKKAAREGDEERIVAIPVGMAICDLALARVVYQRACEKGAGRPSSWPDRSSARERVLPPGGSPRKRWERSAICGDRGPLRRAAPAGRCVRPARAIRAIAASGDFIVGQAPGPPFCGETMNRSQPCTLPTSMFAAILLATFAGEVCHGQEQAGQPAPTIVVAEGERFSPVGPDGWQVVGQEESYASQAFGGMWVTHGGLLKAEAGTAGAEARQVVPIPSDGQFRVWSKYQAPPYFAYPHRLEIHQGGRKIFEHRYGEIDAERMYSFCGETVYGLPPVKQIWFSWGVDHDAAEAAKQTVALRAGSAELRLFSEEARDDPGGARCVDFILLTTDHRDICEGWEKHGQGKSPFLFEALKATPMAMRFHNGAGKPARVRLHTHFGHVTWHCGPKSGVFPEGDAVPPGQWSSWFSLGEILHLATDEGLQVSLVEAEAHGAGDANSPALPGKLSVEFARQLNGGDPIGRVEMASGATVHLSVDLMWNRERTLRLSTELSDELIAAAKTKWRKAAPGKPKHIAFYGSFGRGGSDYALKLKDALGYNTQLPSGMETLPVDGYHQHLRSAEEIRKHAESLGADKRRFRVCSLGDEISLGGIDPEDPAYLEPFRNWLRARGLGRAELGVDPGAATLTGNNRLKWHARLFGAEERFAEYRSLTGAARAAFGPQVLTGANYSPHHGVLYYGDHLQWIDAFKHQAMSMFWTEDYIFFAPELPQVMSFLMARAHCATKYHGQPIHMYVMPHSPGQPAGLFRRNSLLAIGAGAQHIDHFWVAPQENYSENYVSWGATDTFRAIFESIHDTAAAEPFLVKAKRRPARVAVVTGKATAINEDLAPVKVGADQFLQRCHVAGHVMQNICRKDQQALYLALRHAQFLVDLITEDDIVEGRLKDYDAAYLAGEWIQEKAVPKLEEFVNGGGVLTVSTGLGVFNEYGERSTALQKLLGVSAEAARRDLYHYKPLLELPLAEAIGQIELDAGAVEAIAFRQDLKPVAPEVEILGRWSNDKAAAVCRRRVGKGTVLTVGTALGASWLKTGLRPLPWARGGRVNLYHPDGFSAAATRLVRMGVETSVAPRDVVCSRENVEAWLLDNPKGSLVTLINWTNEERLSPLKVEVKVDFRPRSVRSVVTGELPFRWDRGVVSTSCALGDADYLLISR